MPMILRQPERDESKLFGPPVYSRKPKDAFLYKPSQRNEATIALRSNGESAPVRDM